MSVIDPPSHCPRCENRLRGLDLIPLLSFLMLGRKCRYCGTPIGWRYFGVELLTGLLGVALFWKFHANLADFFVYALFAAALIAIVFIDLEHWIIPDQLNIFGIVIGIARDIYGLVTHEAGHSFFYMPVPWSLVGMLICGAIFYAIAYFGELAFKKEAMGGGDIKLAAAIGAVICGSVTSWMGLGLALLSFFIAVFVGSIIGIVVMIFDKRTKRVVDGEEMDEKHMVPFGPMMVAGVFVVWFFGPQLISMYLSYL